MAIKTPGQFQVVMTDVIQHVERAMSENPGSPGLALAKRNFKLLADSVQKGKRPTSQDLKGFAEAETAVRRAMMGADSVLDGMLDLYDYAEAMKDAS